MQSSLPSSVKSLKKLPSLHKTTSLSKGPLPTTKFMSGIMKMKDLSKKKHYDKGYNPFDADDRKSKRKGGRGSTASSTSSGYSQDDGGIMGVLRRFCGCLCPRPKHPILSNSVVTHRKISRVASTDSLSKETSGVLEEPQNPFQTHAHSRPNNFFHRPSPKEQLSQARALNRLNSSIAHSAYTNGDEDASSDFGSSKPTWPMMPPVAAPRNSISQPVPASSDIPSGSSSPVPSQRSTKILSDSPKLSRSSKRPRPTHLSLAVHPAQRCSTPTPNGESPVSTPTTPRGRSGSWAVMKAGLSSLVKAATHSPRLDRAPGFRNADDADGTTNHNGEDDEEEEMPEATCLRPATGGVNNPACECYGSISVRVLRKQGRWVTVAVCGLSGLPWVGGSGGLMLEVAIEPGGRPRWLVLPHAHGPNVSVTLDATVKTPRELKSKHKGLVKVGVWISGRLWRHAALGYSLMQPVETPAPLLLPLLHHTQLSDNLGQVEICLRCGYADNLMSQVVGSSQAEVSLILEVLKAKNLRHFQPGVLSKARQSRKKGQVEVVCRVGLWVKGERVTRESSTPVKLPVTQDPSIRTRCVFTLPRDNLQHAAIIVKILYTSKWSNEDTIGRVHLGPLLYLGTSPEEAASKCPPPDYNTSITLSHWGLALKTPGPVTLWHQLQL